MYEAPKKSKINFSSIEKIAADAGAIGGVEPGVLPPLPGQPTPTPSSIIE